MAASTQQEMSRSLTAKLDQTHKPTVNRSGAKGTISHVPTRFKKGKRNGAVWATAASPAYLAGFLLAVSKLFEGHFRFNTDRLESISDVL